MAEKKRVESTIRTDQADYRSKGIYTHNFSLLVSSPNATQIHEIRPGDTVRIGRGRSLELCIDDPTVSRIHAIIENRRKGNFIRDNGSMNGVWIGGKKIDRQTRIHPGQEIRLGNVLIVLIETHSISKEEKDKFPFSELEQDDDYTEEAEIIVKDEVMENIYNMALKAAPSNATVLINGETGVGKEIFARFIHNHSLHHLSGFIKVFCPSIPESLVESELFGYEKGAFTGAAGRKTGHFESADGGTLLMDEITEVPTSFQIKLLRFFDDKKITRLGGKKEIYVDTRVVATTNKDIKEEVEAGRFRKDLYYRLSTVQFYIPPLRNRKSEIIPMAELFTRRTALKARKKVPAMDEDFKNILLSHNWPGNVRELKSVIENAVIFLEGDVLKADNLLSLITRHENNIRNAYSVFKEKKEEVEKKAIIEALQVCNWNQRKSALLLGISRRSIVYKIKKYGIKRT